MPCSGAEWTDEDLARFDARDLLKNEIDDYKKKIAERDYLVSTLCYACKLLNSHGLLEGDYNLEPFYFEHEIADEMRLNKHFREFDKVEDKNKHLDSIKKRLMIQLTPIEKLALNIELTEHEKKLIGLPEDINNAKLLS